MTHKIDTSTPSPRVTKFIYGYICTRVGNFAKLEISLFSRLKAKPRVVHISEPAFLVHKLRHTINRMCVNFGDDSTWLRWAEVVYKHFWVEK